VTDDPVEAVVLAFLDHLEGLAPRPTLDHLEPDDRARAQELLDGLVAARGIDPRASRPSVESLLMGTPLSGLLPALNPVGNADVTTVARVLAGVDPRARAEIRPDGTVAYSYLDLHARFLLVPTENPVVSEQVRSQVRALFEADPDTSRVGVVAAGSHDLVTQLLAPDEVGHSITTPRGEPHTRWEPTLPLALAARRMLEQSAPEWPSFDFDQAHSEPLDLTAVAAEAARRVIEREAGRFYRGDKRRAYKGLVGHEQLFAELVARVSTHGGDLDLMMETTRIIQAAA